MQAAAAAEILQRALPALVIKAVTEVPEGTTAPYSAPLEEPAASSQAAVAAALQIAVL
jgi:Ca2+/H+ antiporter